MRPRKSPELSRGNREKAVAALRTYLADELDVEAGDLKAGFLLDFFLREIGPSVYNAAMADARAYCEERAEDLEGVFHLPEFPRSSAPDQSSPPDGSDR